MFSSGAGLASTDLTETASARRAKLVGSSSVWVGFPTTPCRKLRKLRPESGDLRGCHRQQKPCQRFTTSGSLRAHIDSRDVELRSAADGDAVLGDEPRMVEGSVIGVEQHQLVGPIELRV